MMSPDIVFKDESIVVYSHMKSNYTIEVLYINMRHKISSVNVPKEFILFIDEAQLLGDNTEPARFMKMRASKAKFACFAFSPIVLSATNAMFEAKCHENRCVYLYSFYSM